MIPENNPPAKTSSADITSKSPLNFKKLILWTISFKSPPIKVYPTTDHKKMGKCMQAKIRELLDSIEGNRLMYKAEANSIIAGTNITLSGKHFFHAKSNINVGAIINEIFFAWKKCL